MISSVKLENIAFSGSNIFVKKAFFVVLGIIAYIALGMVKIPLPFTPVPISGGTMAVYLVSGIFGFRLGLMSAFGYLLLGSLGLPIFAGGASGYLIPTYGYVVGFVLASFIFGFFASKGYNKNPYLLVLSLVLSTLSIYALGLIGLGFSVGFEMPLFFMGMFPFIFGDVVKIIAAFSLIYSIKTTIYK